MDGYEATKAIRGKEIATPVVALTAHAMKGDDRKCKSAGCDDYLAKPVRRTELLDILRKYLPLKSEALSRKVGSVKSQVDELTQLCFDQTASESPLPQPPGNTPLVDWAVVIKTSDDESVVRRTAETVLKRGPDILKCLAEAIEARNAKDALLYAHKLRGTALAIGASPLAEKADRAELAANDKDIDTVAAFFDDLKAEYEKLASFLSQPDWIDIAKRQDTKHV
jgi:hypothetical protein